MFHGGARDLLLKQIHFFTTLQPHAARKGQSLLGEDPELTSLAAVASMPPAPVSIAAGPCSGLVLTGLTAVPLLCQRHISLCSALGEGEPGQALGGEGEARGCFSQEWVWASVLVADTRLCTQASVPPGLTGACVCLPFSWRPAVRRVRGCALAPSPQTGASLLPAEPPEPARQQEEDTRLPRSQDSPLENPARAFCAIGKITWGQ